MDIGLIATATMTFLAPYAGKAAMKIADGIGADLWLKTKKVFKKDEEKALVEKIEAQSASKVELIEFENSFTNYLKEDNDFRNEITLTLNLSAVDTFILESNLEVAQNIKDELKDFYLEQADAGIATEGDYRNVIARQERKLKKIETKIINIMTNNA
jgi:hypothetical protein